MRCATRGAALVLYFVGAVLAGVRAPAAPSQDEQIPLLRYSALLGGSGVDQGYAAVFGPDGALWIAASSSSTDFVGAPRPAGYHGSVVVLRFDSATHALLSSAWIPVNDGGWIPGTGAFRLIFDRVGNPFVAGKVVDGTPGLSVFVTRLLPDGSGVAWTKVIGKGEFGGFALTPDGNPVVCGMTSSAAFPLKDPIRATLGGTWDAFVTEVASDGSGLVFSTLLGGSDISDIEGAGAVAVMPDGAIVVAGHTRSPDFPATARLLGDAASVSQGFLVEIDPRAPSIRRATLLGDTHVGAMVASPDDLLLLGTTTVADFPAAQSPHGPPNGIGHMFLLRLTALDWQVQTAALFGGGNGQTGARSMAAAADGTLWVAGWTTSEDLPVPGAIQPLMGYDSSFFLAAFASQDLSLRYATFLGGDEEEYGGAVAVAPDGSAWIVGGSTSSDFPSVGSAPDLAPPGPGYNLFLANLLLGDPSQVPAAPTALAADVIGGSSVRLRWQAGASDATGFAVYRREDRIGSVHGFRRVAMLPAGTSEWLDTTVVPERRYTFAVQALNAAGGSAPSSVDAQTPSTLAVRIARGSVRSIRNQSIVQLAGRIAPVPGPGVGTIDIRRAGIEWTIDSPFGETVFFSIPPGDPGWKRIRHGWR